MAGPSFKARKPDNLPGFLFNAIKDNYLQQEKDTQAAVEREQAAVQENNEWELAAAKLFSSEVSVREDRPETLFDLGNPLDKATVIAIRKALKERRMDFTCRSRLEDHNMSVLRFLELYGE